MRLVRSLLETAGRAASMRRKYPSWDAQKCTDAVFRDYEQKNAADGWRFNAERANEHKPYISAMTEMALAVEELLELRGYTERLEEDVERLEKQVDRLTGLLAKSK